MGLEEPSSGVINRTAKLEPEIIRLTSTTHQRLSYGDGDVDFILCGWQITYGIERASLYVNREDVGFLTVDVDIKVREIV